MILFKQICKKLIIINKTAFHKGKNEKNEKTIINFNSVII
jgi:hypothetical protein